MIVKNRNSFHNNILKVIEECSYNFYVVQPDKTRKCTCITHSTKQAAPDCPKCLGTGFRITIKSMRGACNDDMKGAASIGKSSQVIKYYFIPNRYKLREDDIVIDDDEAFYVYRIERQKALQGIQTHQEVTAVKRKNDHDLLIANFNKILANHRKQQ